MTPPFKDGNYDRGVEDGVAAISRSSEGNLARTPTAAADPRHASTIVGGFAVPDLPWPERILIGAFIFGIIGLFTVIGVLTPGVGWFLYLFLIPFWAMFPIVIIGPGAARAAWPPTSSATPCEDLAPEGRRGTRTAAPT